jgi:amino-acid N-acetyltransferase
MKGYLFRKATPEDWDEIALLLSSLDLPLDGASAHLANFTIARSPDGLLAGVAGLEIYGQAALLRSVAVAERGTGLGGELVRRVLEEAAASGVRQVALLTTTAAGYFPRFGFRRVPRSQAPMAVQESAEFTGACPDTATVMLLEFPAGS